MQQSCLSTLIGFTMNSDTHLQDDTVCTYFKILGLNPNNLHLFRVPSKVYTTEYKLMVQSCRLYPQIWKQIFLYLKTGFSLLKVYEGFSEEQFKYITNPSMTDTKLQACPGAGKTRSIIARVRFCVEHGLVARDDIYAITFSKKGSVLFHRRIKEMYNDYNECLNLANFSTIDSLAKSVLCRMKSHKSENVEILSIAFRNFLREIEPDQIKAVMKFKHIRYLLIDEAQDLNDVQYEIAILLNKHFGTVICLIADPNQMIFPFRRASNHFFVNFPGKLFELTLNFRSTQQIIDFFECFKVIPTSKTVSAMNKQGPKPRLISKPAIEIHRMFLDFVRNYQAQGKDLSGITVYCPTRGIKTYDSVGLSVIFNFLKQNKIPFSQMYDESGTRDEANKSNDIVPGHINIMTYHGSKGLESDVCWVMDFYHFLFNIQPTKQDHAYAKYLLYVVTSRAVNQLFVCTYTNVNGGFFNNWLSQVSPAYYDTQGYIKISQLSLRNDEIKIDINGVTELLSEMTDQELDTIHDYLIVNETFKECSRRIYDDFTHIDRKQDEALYGTFVENLFYLQHKLSRNESPITYSMIETLLESNFIIIENDADCKLLRNYITNTKLTWEIYYATRNLIDNVRLRDLIEKFIPRGPLEPHEYIICTNKFVTIVDANIKDIRETYHRYLNPNFYNWSYKLIIADLFYLIVVQYAYNNNHYSYINDHGKDKAELLITGETMFEKMNSYAKFNHLGCKLDIHIPVRYAKLHLCGEIDCIERYEATETIIEIKCVKEINIRYYLQLLLYNFCHYQGMPDYMPNGSKHKRLFLNKFKIINFLTGIEHFLMIGLSPTNMFNLLNIIATHGNLKFSNLNLVYDLETTGLIQVAGPFAAKPVLPRSVPFFNLESKQFYANVYPEIIEIAVKDYDTGLIVIDTLVRPKQRISQEIENITHITNDMVSDKIDLGPLREAMEFKTKNFIGCKMLAHNGTIFDNKLMIYDKLIDTASVGFVDTMHLIPVHYPKKLDYKGLLNIYKDLFNEEYPAHRAMSDVDALIRIMHRLKIVL